MFQYHALGLLYHIRKNDRLAVTKLVSKFAKHTLKSPYAYCLLVSGRITITFISGHHLTISVLQSCCAVITEYRMPGNSLRKSTASLLIKTSAVVQLYFRIGTKFIF